MALSTMMTHYLSLKEKYKDCFLFYRLGDFYEMFFDDAIKASKILDLTLTGRDCGLEERAPMCGVPYHSVDTYIAKLVEHGDKVAICEQLSVPGEKPGLVDRDVVRIITSGTLIEDGLIDEKSNNYLLSCVKFSDEYAVSWSDITTGDFYVKQFIGQNAVDSLSDFLVKINPAEIICNTEMQAASEELAAVKHRSLPKFNVYKEYAFSYNLCRKNLLEQLKVHSLDAFGIEDKKAAVCAAGSLLEYLKETQKRSTENINKITLEQNNEYLLLNESALTNLEIVSTLKDRSRYGSLLWLLDDTSTNMGSRYLKTVLLSPLTDKNKINYRLDGVDELYNNTLIRQGLKDLLKSIKDIERITGKISNGNLTPRDTESLGKSLSAIPSVKFQLSGLESRIIRDIDASLIDFTEISKLLQLAIVDNAPVVTKDGGFIRKGFDETLDKLVEMRDNAQSFLKQMEEDEREKTGIKTLRIGYNKVFGYYIEVTNSFKDLVPYNYVRKQTLTGGERYITEELKKFEEEILGSNEKAIRIELQLFAKIKTLLSEHIRDLQSASKAIAALDVILTFAEVSKKYDYVKPEIVDSDKPLDIVGGRHPIVERVSKNQFIANDAYLDTNENRTMIITGPNMAGKSTYMRQNAIIVIMAQCGCFVPCKSASIPVVDRIFTRVGANDNLISDQSTFMVEMTEVANILLNATKNSLLILDEVGRGTSTYDGLSIAWSVIEYINNKIKAKTLFATHYHELSELENIIEGVKNYKITVKELDNTIVFLRKIMRGSAHRSFGIEVASLAGVPKEVTDRAKLLLKVLEKNDLVKNKNKLSNITQETEPQPEVKLSEAEKIIKELNINNLTPVQAFGILADLKEKIG